MNGMKEFMLKLRQDFVVFRVKTAVNNVSFICKRLYTTTLLKGVGVIRTPSKLHKSISYYNKNFLINSTLNGYQGLNSYFRKYGITSNTILDTKRFMNQHLVLDL